VLGQRPLLHQNDLSTTGSRDFAKQEPFLDLAVLVAKTRAICLPSILVVCKPGYVAPRTSQAFNKAGDDGICNLNKDHGNCRRRLANGGKHRDSMREDEVRRKPDSLCSRLLDPIAVRAGPAKIDTQIGIGCPTATFKAVDQSSDPALRFGIRFCKWYQHCNSTNPPGRLSARDSCLQGCPARPSQKISPIHSHLGIPI
jgi:hypothetical protein